jgi:hypothetical protein
MIFGTSEASARSLSVMCGLATIILIVLIGRTAFDARTGLWAGWLGALSPILVVYAREARMYAWLVLVTCFTWLALLNLLRARSAAWTTVYAFSLAVLAYSHPLGLVMGATLALAGLIGARACFGGFRGWLLVHTGALVLILPWVGNYFDHPPEFLSGRLPFRFLLGVPIGFIGGDFRVLAGLLLLIIAGLWYHARCIGTGADGHFAFRDWMRPLFLLLWFAMPPSALYLYSLLSYPIFGPARYTAFVAPPFLVMVAAGLRYIPAWVRYPAAGLLAVISALAINQLTFNPVLKADWRNFARAVALAMDDQPGARVIVYVASTDPAQNVEVETARYYLPESCTVIADDDVRPEQVGDAGFKQVYLAVGLRDGAPVGPVLAAVGGYEFHEWRRYPGLAVFRGARTAPP